MDQTNTKQSLPNQQETIQGVLQNNESVLRSLYAEVFPKVRIYILQNYGNEAHAKDIFQDAFLAFWKNIKKEKYEPRKDIAIQAYLFTIAKNKWIDYLRSADFKKTVTGLEKAPAAQLAWEQEDVQEENKVNENRLEAMRQAMAQLGKECKMVLTQFYFERLSIDTIAEGLKIGSASARNKKYRCMEKLRALTLDYKQNGK